MRRREGEEKVFSQGEDEEAGVETEEGEGKEEKVSEKEGTAAEGEEVEHVRPKRGQEVQIGDKVQSKEETVTDEQGELRCVEEKDEQRKCRKRRGKRQNERVRNRRGQKDDKREEKKSSRTQEASAVSSEDSSALSEPPIGLMNSCDLSDPIYLGCSGAGMYYPPGPVPLLYTSQPPVPIQTTPSQGTKRPHSPLLPPSLSQQCLQPLEVRRHCYHSLIHSTH